MKLLHQDLNKACHHYLRTCPLQRGHLSCWTVDARVLSSLAVGVEPAALTAHRLLNPYQGCLRDPRPATTMLEEQTMLYEY